MPKEKKDYLLRAGSGKLERWTGIGPAAFSLARRRSTDELPPHFVPRPGIEPGLELLQSPAMTD